MIARYKKRHGTKFRMGKKSAAIMKKSSKADRAYFKNQFSKDDVKDPNINHPRTLKDIFSTERRRRRANSARGSPIAA